METVRKSMQGKKTYRAYRATAADAGAATGTAATAAATTTTATTTTATTATWAFTSAYNSLRLFTKHQSGSIMNTKRRYSLWPARCLRESSWDYVELNWASMLDVEKDATSWRVHTKQRRGITIICNL